MTEPKPNDKIVLLKDSGLFKKGEKYVINRVDQSMIYFQSERAVYSSYWVLRSEQNDVWALCKAGWGDPLPKKIDYHGVPVETSFAPPEGFIGSQNLPIDLDWDEYER